jgi:DNA-binding IclR family transcriptional regulator
LAWQKEKSEYLIQSVPILDLLEQFHGEVDGGVTELSKRLKLQEQRSDSWPPLSRGYIDQNKATENYCLGLKPSSWARLS